MDYEPEACLHFICADRPGFLKAMIQLCGISCHIRSEVHAWLAAKVCFVRLAMTFKDRSLLPGPIFLKDPTILEKQSIEWKDHFLDAPRYLKFGRLFVNLHIETSGLIGAAVDFRRRTVLVIGARADLNRTVIRLNEIREGEHLSYEAMQTSKESLTKSMQAVIDQEGFDGFTLRDLQVVQ